MKPKSLKLLQNWMISYRLDHLDAGHPISTDRGYQRSAKIWSFDALGRKHNNGLMVNDDGYYMVNIWLICMVNDC